MLSYAQPAVMYVLRLVHIAIASTYKDATVYLFNSFMLNKLFNNTVVRHGHSDCADRIVVNVMDANCIVYYTNGSVYLYQGVSRRALINLVLNDNISLGRWINDVLLYCNSKCAQTGSCALMYNAA